GIPRVVIRAPATVSVRAGSSSVSDGAGRRPPCLREPPVELGADLALVRDRETVLGHDAQRAQDPYQRAHARGKMRRLLLQGYEHRLEVALDAQYDFAYGAVDGQNLDRLVPLHRRAGDRLMGVGRVGQQ